MGQQDVGFPWRRRASAAAAALCLLLIAGCNRPSEQDLREALTQQLTGVIELPAGTIEISSEVKIPAGANDLEITGPSTVLRAAPGFKGRALLVVEGVRNIRLRDFVIDGNRGAFTEPFPMAPPENAFRVWYRNNGILVDQVEGFDATRLQISGVAAFPILVSRSTRIRMRDLLIRDSGSTDAMGRNNTTGGVVIEEGSSDFEVRNSTFQRIRGNALWTHSLFTSPRLADGVIAENHFETIGRDAIQVGHATRVRVDRNTGDGIGYPITIVDFENGGTPVAVDTAGDVDQSEYTSNTFREVNGKCIDLDGFHDGAVRGNTCTNPGVAADYPYGHFGIVMNNTNPDAHSNNIEIRGNSIVGAKFGGLFLMGSGNTVTGNRFVDLNLAGCNENAAEFGCLYKADEPDMLASGIYLSRGVARLEETKGNVIRGNEIRGHKMATRCIAAGPGVAVADNTVEGNTCGDAAPRP